MMLDTHTNFRAMNWPPSVSPADVAIIVVAALIILGPKKWPDLLRDLGKAMRELREITRNK